MSPVDPELAFLDRLADPARAEAAWGEFVDRFSPVLLRVARRFTNHEDELLDVYLRVCERLIADDYRRLRAFRAGDASAFSGWLAAVARNLCIDHFRSAHGRRRLPTAVARLPELERELFELRHWQDATDEAAEAQLRARHPEVTAERIAEAHAAVAQAVAASRAGRHSAGASAPHREPGAAAAESDQIEAVADPAPDPETELLSRERRTLLEQAVAELPAADRMLLRLRYEEGLTLRAAGLAAGIRDAKRAHERFGRIFRALRERLGGNRA